MVFGFNLDPTGAAHRINRPPPPRNGTKHHSIGDVFGALKSSLIPPRVGKKGK